MPPRRAAAPSETPARTTRTRSKTPLPAIESNQSTAYGAPGKAPLGGQMRQSGEDFSAQFEESRASVATAIAPQATFARRSGGSVAGDRAVASPAPAPRPAPAAVLPRDPDTVLDRRAVYESARSALPMTKRDWVFATFFAAFFFFGAFATYFMGLYAAFGYLGRTWNQFKDYEVMKDQLGDFEMPQYQYAINQLVQRQIARLEVRVAAVEESLNLTQDALEETRRMLPTHILVDFIDGKPTISPDFWTALQSKLATHTDLAPAWQAWLLRNDQHVSLKLHEYAGAVVKDRLESGQVIQKEDFLRMLDEQNTFLMSKYQEEAREFTRKQSAMLQDMADSKFDAAIQKLPTSSQLDRLLYTYELQWSYRNRQFLNFFSFGLGARVNPHLTSVTKGMAPKGWFSGIMRLIALPAPKPLAPVTALLAWEEPGECWCGTPTKEGHVQIGVITPHKFHPIELVIEHAPRTMILDGDAAPQQYEVWIDLGSKAELERVKGLWGKTWLGPDPTDACGKPPTGGNWLCASYGTYKMDIQKYIQTFAIDIQAVNNNITTNKAVVRAVSNHGAPYTCFYRLKLTGTTEGQWEPKPEPEWEAIR